MAIVRRGRYGGLILADLRVKSGMLPFGKKVKKMFLRTVTLLLVLGLMPELGLTLEDIRN